MERSTVLMKKAQEEAEKHKVALAEALEKANANAPPSTDSVDMKRHIAELKAQEEKLKAEHETELKSRVDAAVQEALKDRPAPPSDGTFTPEQQAAIDAAIETYKEGFKKDLDAAVDRGRKEIEIRIKLKDSQLTRAQSRVKELEMQVNDWVTKGLVTLPVKQPATPTATTSAASATSDPSTSTTPAASAAPNAQNAKPTTTVAAKPAPAPAKPAAPATAPQAGSARPNPAAAATAAAASNTGLPRRPPVPGAAPARGGAPVRGRGGAVRGGALRQMPQKPTGQQAVPPAAPPAALPATGGVSIIGAASKRPHDDAAAGENSLAKRMKPNGAP
jgi:nucleoprotein TPR